MSSLREARIALFERAFQDGYRHVENYIDTGDAEIVFRLHSAPHKVKTKGGQLEVGGCLFPAARGLPPGEYPVQCAQGVPAKGSPRSAFVNEPRAPCRLTAPSSTTLLD